MRIRNGLRLASALWLAAMVPAAPAAVITYEATSRGGGTWQYDYVVTNDDPGLPFIDWFAIRFDQAIYTAPTFISIAAPTGWDPIAYEPDAGLPDDGFADWQVFVRATGIGFGESLGGFSTQFVLPDGQAEPGSQIFEIYDFANYDPELPIPIYGRGNTTPAASVSVPEPGSLALLALGLAGVLGSARARRRGARA